MKAFISYAHSDEEHLRRLKVSLAQVKREGLITDWHDREIPPGERISKEIKANLDNSTIFIALLSPDYLDSEYCMDVELSSALRQDKIIIPIIIRQCDWLNSTLSDKNALPPDGHAVATYNDQDLAWQEVVKGIRTTVTRCHIPYGESETPSLRNDFLEFLNDPGTTLLHAHGHHLSLDDVFVYPELERRDSNYDLEANLLTRADHILKRPYTLIFGDEQSGKTILAKRLFSDAIHEGRVPVLVNGADLKNAAIGNVVKKPLAQQYVTPPKSFDLIIVDDVHLSKLNFDALARFIRSATEENVELVLFADPSYRYACQDVDELSEFDLYEILELNQERKAALIKRWVVCGREETISDDEKFSEIDRIKVQINDVMGRNLIPAKPIYILSVLQALETVSPTDLQLTSYAHCYHHLIISALSKAGAKTKEFDSYVNFLTHLAHFVHSREESRNLSKGELNSFVAQYQKEFVLPDPDRTLSTLEKARILRNKDSTIRFRDNYIYYFYVAKYFADYATPSLLLQSNVKRLLDELHIEENANIIVFLAHHSRDEALLKEIEEEMSRMFGSRSEATLGQKQLSFLGDLVHRIPKLVLEHRSPEESRKDQYKKEQERIDSEEELSKQAESMAPEDVPAQIYRSFKAIEICGQIIRNRFGSLNKPALSSLVDSTYGVGMRFIDFYLEALQDTQTEIIGLIERLVRQDPQVSHEELEREARSVILWATFGTMYGAIKRIGYCVGTKECMNVYEQQTDNRDSPAAKLVEAYIRLFYARDLNADVFEKLYLELEGNPICQRILKCLVIEFIYMNNVHFKKRQELSQAVKVKPNKLRALTKH